MVAHAFLTYLKEQILPYKIKHGIRRPILLLCDGVASHQSLQITEFCMANDIIVCRLLPNTSHMLQPCDLSIFKSFKSKWKRAVIKFTRKSLTTVINFAQRMLTSWTAITTATGKSGFRRAGIFPWEPTRKYLPRVVALQN